LAIEEADFKDIVTIHNGGDFELMGIRHKEYPIQGIQFHPESFATEGGKDLIKKLFCFRFDRVEILYD